MSDDAREVLKHYVSTLDGLARQLDDRFDSVVTDLVECRGQVVVTGMGKPGYIGQKISATLASTGTPSIYLHPAEALHGDLGRVRREDVVIVLSNSGETKEVIDLIAPLKRIGARIIAMTGNLESHIARHADTVLHIGNVTEACPMRLAPTASTLAMLALGDALALSVLKRREFGPEEFAAFHPAGSLGRSLLKVEEIMRTGASNPTIGEGRPAREAILAITKARAGAVSIVDGEGRMVGILTDGDIRRHFQRGDDWASGPVEEVMTRSPKSIRPEKLAAEALRIMQDHKIDELPVVDADGQAVGMLDVQDLLAVGLVLPGKGGT